MGFTLGWEEWLSLPGLGLPAIRAKVDTGAKTSALHATVIEPFGPAEKPQVRFLIQPNPEDPTLEITCSANVIDQRQITSSNGQTEMRYVIEADVEMGDRRWPIELTLTNRENMAYRMLLGRSAITEDMLVDVNSARVQPDLSFAAYKGTRRKRPVKRPLRIALLSREPKNYSNRRLVEAAEARGHVIEVLDTNRCYMRITSQQAEVHYDGTVLPRFDAVIPRIGASVTAYGAAVLRQFAATGAYCLNDAAGIVASRDKLLAHQVLAQANIPMPVTAFANSPKVTQDLINLAGEAPVVVKLQESTQGRGVVLAETRKAAESLIDAFRGLEANFLVQSFIKEASGADTRLLVIGNKVVGAMQRKAQEGEFRSNLHRGGQAITIKPSKQQILIARKATRQLGLSVAGVDLVDSADGPLVLEVNSSPGLQGIEAASDSDIATLIIQHIERNVRTLGPVREPKATRTPSE